MRIVPGDIKTGHLHALLLGSVAPRPIAFASTVDAGGNVNLSPFSFFNVFGSRPPVMAFSPARRVRDNTVKHTLENVLATREVVINAVTHAIVHQASLSSCEYPRGVDEFTKAGLTPIPSEKVRPPRVKESPVQMECRVLDVIETGHEGGAANIILCEMLVMHIDDRVLNEEQRIDPNKIDLVGRMSGEYYCRASGPALFKVPKPNRDLGIGIDNLPAAVRLSDILTGNDLARLANTAHLPGETDLAAYAERTEVMKLLEEIDRNPPAARTALHLAAKKLIETGHADEALMLLLCRS